MLPEQDRFRLRKQVQGRSSFFHGGVTYLRAGSGIGTSRLLTRVLLTYPAVQVVPFSQTGAPADWRSSDLWQ